MMVLQIKIIVLFVALAGIILMAGCAGSSKEMSELDSKPDQASSRSFFMGFTPFPWDMTLEAMADTGQFIVANGDIISHHLEQGVPWTEALDDKPYHPKMMKDWEGRRKLSANKKLFLSVTPLNEGRNSMELYRGEDEDMPLPDSFKDKAFNDPIVKRAYLNYCRRAADYFQPDYFAVGIEVNELFHNSPQMWSPFVELHKFIYTELKQSYPDLPIFFTVSLHNLTNPSWNDLEKQQEEVGKLLEFSDIVGISYYPFMAGQSERPIETFKWIKNFTVKPLVVTETGFPAEDIVLKTYGITIPGSPEKQTAFFETLLNIANKDEYLFVIAFLYRDYDALFNKIAPELEKRDLTLDIFSVWKDCGMVDEKGAERPALEVWRRYLALKNKKQ
jgi:hypothetical protein